MRSTLCMCSRSKLLLLLTIVSGSLFAQKTPQQLEETKQKILSSGKVKSVSISAERQTPSFIVMHAGGQGFSKAQAKQALGSYLGLRAGVDDLISTREAALPNGMQVQEFQQYFKGIRVEQSRFASFVKNDRVQFFNGAFYDVPATLPTRPGLSEADALGLAKARVGATKYAWEQLQEYVAKAADAATKAALQAELNEYLPKGELVIIKDFGKEGGLAQMHLAYKFNIYAFEPLSRDYVYVDAMDGKILLVDKIIKHVDKPGPGAPLPSSVAITVKTRYAGNRNIFTKQISGTDPNNGQLLLASNPTEVYTPGAATYSLIDDSKGGGIETYDLNAVGGLPISLAPAYSLAKAFTDVDNNWTLAEHARGNLLAVPDEAENDDIAWDAHWGASVVYDYWKTKQNRLSFDDKDAKIKSYIHSGLAYDNAFWNGKVMTYGDGSYPAKSNGFRPLTSLDVCAHEIGHGVCTFTSNLVYAKESGAMNEGFSDIWAACTEYYAIKHVDPSLGSVYKPFYIGEQIAANPAVPLRRMDNPLARNNPDTYGGRRWTSQVGCSPTLANDQCGVHNNSGVLNKWFYLLTVGSGGGSGPDAAFAGEDDGINDKGNTYSVTGLGFDVAEKITYLTEMLLTSTATYEEARMVSIQVATEMSGSPCADLVKQVTNAWYAVGVGDAFVEPCKIAYGFLTQPGSSVSEGVAGAGCTAETEVKLPVLLPAGATGTVSAAGTATSGVDYRLGTTSLSNTGTTPKSVDLSVFVKNDAVVEGEESVDLTITLTNVGSNTFNDKYRLNIIEDDVVPVIGNQQKSVLAGGDFNNQPDGFNSPAGWTEIIGKEGTGATGENYNQWGVWNGKLMVTGKLDAAGPVMPAGSYNSNSPSNTIIHSPLIDARGLSNLVVKFDYRVQGEVDPNGVHIEAWGVYDYMAVVYSFDGVNFFELSEKEGFGPFASAEPSTGTVEARLPSYLNNKTFYIGFRWFNDTNAGGPESVQIDNVSLVGAPRKMENEQGHNSRENLGAGLDVYFYSVQDGEILSRINNTSSRNFGCTNVYVEKGGTGTFNLYQGTDGLHKVADKIVRVEATNIYKATSVLTLYFTEEQLVALENATGKKRTEFYIYQVDAAAYTGAKTQNTKKYPVSYTPIEGVGGSFTVSFNEKVNGSYALGVVVSSKGLLSISQSPNSQLELGAVSNNWKFENVFPNPGTGNAYISINAPQQQRVRVEISNLNGQVVQAQGYNLQPGTTRLQLQLQHLAHGSYWISIKDEKGLVLNTQSYIKR